MVLLAQEPDYFTGEPRWTFPSGHMEDGEDPATAAARELAEESGCVIHPTQLELIAVADVTQNGETISRSWNYTATPIDAAVAPRVDDDETVTEARWFERLEAVKLLGQSSYAPKIEPAVRFLMTGEHIVHWTFELIDNPAPTPTFRWDPPVALKN